MRAAGRSSARWTRRKPHGRTDPRRLRLVRAARHAGGAADRGRRGRARAIRRPAAGSSTSGLRAARAPARAAAGRQPRHGDVGADRLPGAAALHRPPVRQRVRRGASGAARDAIDQRFGPHASDLFSTAYAVDDLAAVIRRAAPRAASTSTATPTARTSCSRSWPAIRSCCIGGARLGLLRRTDLDPWYASSGDRCPRRDGRRSRPARPTGWPQLVAQVRVKPIAGATRDADGSRSHGRPARAGRSRPGLGL